MTNTNTNTNLDNIQPVDRERVLRVRELLAHLQAGRIDQQTFRRLSSLATALR